MAGGIYLIQGDGQLVEMTEQAYDSEDLLQGLLANYPSLLAGDQVDSIAPRRWLLVSRERAVPSEEGGGGRWSLDHLFLDQDAVPTLVEVKRGTDTRARREVIGQMLDYAANGIAYWPVHQVRAQFELTCRDQGPDPEEQLRAFLGNDADLERFWQEVATNLAAGRVRLVFVADEIPPELRRIVEFLNGQMSPAEVLAIEIKQYVGQGLKTLVPRVIGQTAAAEQKKSSGPRQTRQWDEASFLQDLKARHGDAEAETVRRVLRWAEAGGFRIGWGKGAKDGAFWPTVDHKGQPHSLIYVYTWGALQIPFQTVGQRPPFNDESKRLDLLERLNQIAGVRLPPDAISRYPSIRLGTLNDPAALEQFLGTLDWVVQEIRAT